MGHPSKQSWRVIDLDGRELIYAFRRSPRARAMRIVVDEEGVFVVVPRWVTLEQVSAFLHEESVWIFRKLEQLRNAHHDRKRRLERYRGTFFYNGNVLPLVVRRGSGKSVEVAFTPDGIFVDAPPSAPEDVFKALNRRLTEHARKVLMERVMQRSIEMQLSPAKITIRNQRTIWGSCSGKQVVSLNRRLIQAPPEALDYVVVHELAHLRYLTHGPRFWGLVKRFCPQYREHRDWLNKEGWKLRWLSPDDVVAALEPSGDACEAVEAEIRKFGQLEFSYA